MSLKGCSPSLPFPSLFLLSPSSPPLRAKNNSIEVYQRQLGTRPLFPRPPRWPSGKASASRAEDPGFESRLRRNFSGSSHTSDSKIGTLVATLPWAWCYRVSTGTGRPGVSILWLGEVESLICNFYLRVAARSLLTGDWNRPCTIVNSHHVSGTREYDWIPSAIIKQAESNCGHPFAFRWGVCEYCAWARYLTTI